MEPVTIGFALFGIIAPAGIWALRTEGRVNSVKELVEERDKQDSKREQLIHMRLDRIENKMDAYFLSNKGRAVS